MGAKFGNELKKDIREHIMKKTIISVVMAVYNEELDELRKAIESILSQTFEQFEFIIILDNPGNLELKEMLESYKSMDERILLMVNDNNIGLAASLNRGLKQSKGKYIARMDADDVSEKNRLEVEFAAIKTNNLDLISSSCVFIDESESITGKHAMMVTNPIYVKELLSEGNFLVHPSIMGKKSVFEILSGYQEGLPASEDYDLWLRIIMSGYRIGALNESLVRYRIRANSMTQSDLYKTFLVSQFIKMQRLGGNIVVSEEYIRELEQYLEEKCYYDTKIREKFNKGVHIFSRAKKDKKISLIICACFNWITCKQLRAYQKSRSSYRREYQRLLALDKKQ